MLADALDLPPDTVRRVLTAEDLARIDSYAGGARDLHELLAAVLPLDRPRWYEVTITARRGTVMTLGYLAEPADDGLDVSLVIAASGQLVHWPGPARVTARGMHPPHGMPDDTFRELQAAAGIILRAVLLGL